MRGLEHLLIGRQRQLGFHQVLGLLFVRAEGGEQKLGVGMLEVVGRLLHLVLVEHVAIGQLAATTVTTRVIRPDQVVHVLHALQIHGQALQTIGDLAGCGLAVDATHLLEIGELRHLHAVEPDFPAQAPCAQRRVFPVVLDEADVVLLQVKAQRFQRAQVQLQNVVRRGLQDHLVLIVMLATVGVLAIAAVLGAAAGLHIGSLPWLRPQGAQEGGGVRGARPDLHVVGLQEGAALVGPVGLQSKNDLLECEHGRGFEGGGRRCARESGILGRH
ncbi:hypothetical protein SDC9_144300 [bioreactor metagenome]|uniref:Uncharacterized protein n=1 Tax=bioreactor metagenome TaxID=1076179 RepID=A0A645E5U9_9ZZZZ